MPSIIPVPITALYASLLALFLVILAFPVIKLRHGLRVGLGDGGNRSLQQAMRAHGNAAENFPMFILLLAVYELNHASPLVLHGFGAAFLLARLFHAGGLYTSPGSSFGRILGTAVTFTILGALAIANVVLLLSK
jgi:uncharacterized protein